MHVIHAARAGGHAGEAREAAVDVVGHGRRDLTLLKHLLHQIDAAARAVALISSEHIGRAGGDAQAAMDAAPEDRVGTGDGRVGELHRVELGLHGLAYIPAYMRPGLRIPTGSNARLSAAVSAMSGGWGGGDTTINPRARGASRVSVAGRRHFAKRGAGDLDGSSVGDGGSFKPDQPA